MNLPHIHPTAVIDPQAKIHESVEIGPFVVINAGVSIGANCIIYPHATITGNTDIGQGNKIYQGAIIGEHTQDKKFKGDPSKLVIGNFNTIRECCTINSGDVENDQFTEIGDYNNVLAYAHIGHNSKVGNHNVLVNNVQVAGHVVIQNHVTIGGSSGIHQFCRIGDHVMVGGYSTVLRDIPPFVLVDGKPARAFGINSIGLKRCGFNEKQLKQVKQCFRILFRLGLDESAILDQLLNEGNEYALLVHSFIINSERGLIRSHARKQKKDGIE